MLDTKAFGEGLKTRGFNFYSGVPCSFLKDLINYAINTSDFVMSANEGQAVAICAGAHLSGKKAVFLCQNSGLTNAISPLTSLNAIFKIPVMGFVSLRGEKGLSDEPQHDLMGVITSDMLSTIKVKWEYLSADLDTALKQLDTANQTIEQNESFFFIVKKDLFAKEKLNPVQPRHCINEKLLPRLKAPVMPKRIDLLQQIVKQKTPRSVFIATTGFTGRELYELEDSEQNLYVVGSMGCASSIGLGLALNRPDKEVIVLDGDAALLMHAGSLATNAYYSPSNLLHILLDNSAHESTGGQFTVSPNVNFASMAAAAGYRVSVYAHSIDEVLQAIKDYRNFPRLTFIHAPILMGSKDNLGRPKVKPFEVKERLMNFLNKA